MVSWYAGRFDRKAVKRHHLTTPKRLNKDMNEMAAQIVSQVADLWLSGQNPAAVALGRRGAEAWPCRSRSVVLSEGQANRQEGRQSPLEQKENGGLRLPGTRIGPCAARRPVVTVCVGIACRDGMVLAADTQVTYIGSHKDYAPKIDSFSTPGFSIGLSGAGSFDILNDTFSRVRREISALRPSYDDIRDGIQQILTQTVKRHPTDTEFQYLLVAVVIPPNTRRLVHFLKDIVTETPQHSRAEFIIGAGNTHLTDHIKNDWIKEKPTSVLEGLHWAAYIVKLAKGFVDRCGGDTDAIVLHGDGRVEIISRERTKHYESYVEEIEEEISGLFRRLGIGVENATELDISLSCFSERLKQLHAEKST